MSKIQKHQFEPVSLLTADNGVLSITVIPAVGQPDWLVPTSLIMSVDDYDERIWTYLWQNQEVSVYHLVPEDVSVDKLVVLEGNSDVHRLALQTTGKLSTKKVRISDVQDVELSEEEMANIKFNTRRQATSKTKKDSYLYQAVMIDDEVFIVPDLDLIAHHLVDLDG